MVWLAVDFNGDETISPGKPKRDFREWSFEEEICIESEYGITYLTITLPKGTIQKLIGKELTWNDEPIELK